MTGTATSLTDAVQLAWDNAGLLWKAASNGHSHLVLLIEREQRERALEITLRSLTAAGCRTCADRRPSVWSIFGFSENEAIRIDLADPSGGSRFTLRSLAGCVSPCLALEGPDGVGKSTALGSVREWFASNAPFLEIQVRQWRPALLPPLAKFLGRAQDSSVDQRPRRDPGNLQYLRLIYYFFDYVLGGWHKDRNRSDAARCIVYDRCALDMMVDPYRFGLASGRGTRLLWKLIPRPKTLILLYDDPERIAARKCDLQEHEIAEQMPVWLKLAAQDRIHAIIRADAGAAEVARCVRDLLMESFIARYEHAFQPSGPDTLLATREILEAGQDESAGEEYAVLPDSRNPRFLIPVRHGKAAAALGVYNPQRLGARIRKRLLTAALRAGIAQPLLGDRIPIRSQFLKQIFADIFGQKDITFAVSAGTQGPNQKPVLQIVNTLGQELGYAKIGWNQHTKRSIRNEASALHKLQGIRFSDAVVPAVLHAATVGERYLLVQSSCGASGRSTTKLSWKLVRFLAELHQIGSSTGKLPVPDRNRIEILRRDGFHYYAHVLDWAREYSEYFGAVPFGPSHGDFASWNVRHMGGKFAVFDWEFFQSSAPAAWDLFHYIVASRVEIEDWLPGRIYRDITGTGETADLVRKYFRLIGAPEGLIVPLLASYAAESLAQSAILLGRNASHKNRMLQRTWAALLGLICCGNREALDQALCVKARGAS